VALLESDASLMEAELPRIVLEKSRGRYHSPVGRRLPGTSRADPLLLPQAAKRLHCDLGFLVGMWEDFPFAILTSICRSIVTICSALYLLIGM
jgi:hypothetical protein